jgi:rSAM/selenodomain-associated transferase 1
MLNASLCGVNDDVGRAAAGLSPPPRASTFSRPHPISPCRAAAISPVILVFVRAPLPGTVKRRLAAGIGAEAALAVYRHLAERAVAAARALEPGVRVRVHFTPAAEEESVREWLGEGPEYLPQRGEDLGERLRMACDEAFGAGYGPLLVIGSDLPGLCAGVLRQGLALLASHASVLGPALDGGYYLLGLRDPVQGVFDRIPWSSDAVLGTTLRRLAAAGLDPALLPPLRDVDSVADLPAGWEAWAKEAAVPR